VCFSLFSVPVCLCFVKMPGTHHRKYGGSLLQSCFLIRTELLLSLMCRFAFFISILFDGLRTLALLVPHVLSPPWTWSRDMTYFDAVNLFATWLNCVSSHYANNSPPRWLDYQCRRCLFLLFVSEGMRFIIPSIPIPVSPYTTLFWFGHDNIGSLTVLLSVWSSGSDSCMVAFWDLLFSSR